MIELTKQFISPGLLVTRDEQMGVVKTTYGANPYVVFHPKGDWEDFRNDDAVKCFIDDISLGWDSGHTGKHWHDQYEILRYAPAHGLCGLIREDDGSGVVVRDIEGTDRRSFKFETLHLAAVALSRWSGQRRPPGEIMEEWEG